MANSSVELSININPDIDVFSSISTVSSSNNNTNLSDIDSLIIEEYQSETNIEISPFMTLEHNINILDGSLEEYNNTDDNLKKYGYFSTNLSGNDCSCNNTITIDFNTGTSPVNIYGLLFDFTDNKYILNNSIAFTDTNNTIISNLFYPTSSLSREFNKFSNLKKIVISFIETRFPRMFCRVNYISFDLSYIFRSQEIISCNFKEEFSPISQVLPITTCDVSIYSPYNEFDLINNTGISDILGKGYLCQLYGIIDNTHFLMHTLHIDSIEGQEDNIIKIKLISLIGLLSNYYYSPKYLMFGSAQTIISEVLSGTNIPYSIDKNLNNTFSNIFLNSGNVREILQSILFLINACINDKAGILEIYKIKYTVTNTIDESVILGFPKISKIASGQTLAVTFYDYDYQFKGQGTAKNLQYSVLYEGMLTTDGIEFNFEKPVTVLRYKIYNESGAEITENKNDPSIPGAIFISSGDYMILNISKLSNTYGTLKYKIIPHNTNVVDLTKVTYKIEVNYWLEFKNTHIEGNSNSNNIIKIDNMKIFNKDNVSSFSKYIYDYYDNNTFKVEFTYLWNGNIRTGDTVYIYTDYKHILRGTILKQSIDLGNGFISNAVAVGNIIYTGDQYYTTSGDDNLGNSGQYDLIMGNNIQI